MASRRQAERRYGMAVAHAEGRDDRREPRVVVWGGKPGWDLQVGSFDDRSRSLQLRVDAQIAYIRARVRELESARSLAREAFGG